VSLLLGDGDNVVDLADLDDGAQVSVVLGAGDDELTIDLGTGEDVEGTIDFGIGDNTLILAAGADLSDVESLTITGYDTLELSDDSANAASNATVAGSLINGGSFTVTGADTTDELAVEIETTITSFDASNIVFSDSASTGAEGLVVTGGKASGSVTYKLTNGADEITTSAADATVYGYAGADTLNGAGGDDTFHGGKGDDTIIGNAGDDTYVFAATGALNGKDTITFVVADDVLDLSAMFSGGALQANPAIPVAIAGTDDVDMTDTIVLLDAGASTDANSDEVADAADTATEIAALIEGASDALELDSGGKGIVIVGYDNATPGVDAAIWLIDDSLGATEGSIDADDAVLVGLLVDLELGKKKLHIQHTKITILKVHVQLLLVLKTNSLLHTHLKLF